MNPKKKSRRCLGLDSGLDLAISRFIYSLEHNRPTVIQRTGPDGRPVQLSWGREAGKAFGMAACEGNSSWMPI